MTNKEKHDALNEEAISLIKRLDGLLALLDGGALANGQKSDAPTVKEVNRNVH